jgi:hypothetical protein
VLDCSGAERPFCDPADNRCKECGDGTPCTSEELPFCGADHTCKQCLQSDQCVLVPFGTVPECGTDGVCRFPCAGPDFVDCNGTCIAAGTCCCAGGDVCQSDGVTCAPRCTPGVPACNAATGVPQVCGEDGVLTDAQACPSGQECKLPAGACGCIDAALTLCGTACVDTQTDEANCNGCGSACADGETCSAGSCEPSLPVLGQPCPDDVCGGGGVCSGGFCCDRLCQGPCETCATSTCQILTSSTECVCAAVLADAACTRPPLVPPPLDLPPGEGQCAADGQCASPDEVCPQPAALGTGCLDDTGTCQDDGSGTGFIVCVVPEPDVPEPDVPEPDVPEPDVPDGPLLGEACAADGECGQGTCSNDGVCCAVDCSGPCQTCAGGASCVPVAPGTTDSECPAAVACPIQQLACTAEPIIPIALPGQCFAGRCATEAEICRQPFNPLPTCPLEGGATGQCQVDAEGATTCVP